MGMNNAIPYIMTYLHMYLLLKNDKMPVKVGEVTKAAIFGTSFDLR